MKNPYVLRRFALIMTVSFVAMAVGALCVSLFWKGHEVYRAAMSFAVAAAVMMTVKRNAEKQIRDGRQ